ncbi:hypothetical protein [Methanolobus chelungpuianus]|uniref:Uncharacterized protein n=1 Tax=Methanolobus chelungpuianus TaxID=502115 RepID=A0AAE3KYG7_9EURY|nr:hypothetical protein [Methanolobus chelungpuianus]MCQ6963786.1 hypothetical protein [Methanolobus chelungpuianus]
MVLIESTELLENLSFLLKVSQEFKLHETSKAYEDIIRHIRSMENEILLEEGCFEHFRSPKKCKCMAD